MEHMDPGPLQRLPKNHPESWPVGIFYVFSLRWVGAVVSCCLGSWFDVKLLGSWKGWVLGSWWHRISIREEL